MSPTTAKIILFGPDVVLWAVALFFVGRLVWTMIKEGIRHRRYMAWIERRADESPEEHVKRIWEGFAE